MTLYKVCYRKCENKSEEELLVGYYTTNSKAQDKCDRLDIMGFPKYGWKLEIATVEIDTDDEDALVI